MNKRHQLGFNIKLAADNDLAVINIFGSIGRDYWEEFLTGEESKNTASAFEKNLKDITASKIRVNINSYGGDANDGLVIHDLLREHAAEIETYVYGFTASAGTVIAQAGKTRYMSENAMYLIHEAHAGIYGTYNIAGLKKHIERLEPLNELVTNLYLRGAGADEQKIRDLMAADNGGGKFIGAEEALEAGLIDKIFTPDADEEEQSDAADLEAATQAILSTSQAGTTISAADLEAATISASNGTLNRDTIATLAQKQRERRLKVLQLTQK